MKLRTWFLLPAWLCMAVLFAAPFLIVRNTVRGRRIEGRNFGFAALAAIVAGFWSLLSGSVVVLALQAVGHLVA